MNTPEEYAMEEFYDQISKELYPEHKEQAIEEFTDEKTKVILFKKSGCYASSC